ncbi:hypothetical protein [Anoxybacillus flavithermus]|uniref:hypothetical protein n=1 Tax=Anoxybacillus flavithermus TaxID=33934 RepID=UPI00186789C4|nr:hypothetical protein [Anoxybacillus flavithermus]MBE2912616.1 hypothetical protein [Anoxybacillus flavithermus]
MLALIKKIAQYLVKNWDKLAEWIKKASEFAIGFLRDREPSNRKELELYSFIF